MHSLGDVEPTWDADEIAAMPRWYAACDLMASFPHAHDAGQLKNQSGSAEKGYRSNLPTVPVGQKKSTVLFGRIDSELGAVRTSENPTTWLMLPETAPTSEACGWEKFVTSSTQGQFCVQSLESPTYMDTG